MRPLNKLEEKIGYSFIRKELLLLSLTHSSYANEHGTECNERLEYLGDAVLELAMSRYLYDKLHLDEGVLSKTRAKAVCEEALNVYADKIDLSAYLLLGNGEEHSGGRQRPAIIADAFEAVLGAVFLDSDFETVYRVIGKIVFPYYDLVMEFKDYKSIFQEKVQADKRTLHYEIVKDEGPANDKYYEAVVYMDEILMGRGCGKTKKEAEQNAAKQALMKEAK
ncbi:MAG TPA: ribonuclease III [Candidatus Pelethenecus faecipullorum]|uniref:Ribonuclease 3 n=1 Tax=Candidatus Pelethenecus faecipullorum TaxID=2840900 RepID=A0A9D1GT34_9MOLU|nr:ribonuclease III [Candidatus Pelethenecus faecipullorum]